MGIFGKSDNLHCAHTFLKPIYPVNIFLIFCIYEHVYVRVHVWACACHKVCMVIRHWFIGSVLSFHHLGSRDQTQIIWLASKCLYCWAIWSALMYVFEWQSCRSLSREQFSSVKSWLLLPKFSQPTDWPSWHSSQHTEWELLLPRQSLPIFSVLRCSLTEQNTLKMISLSLTGNSFPCTGSARACCHTAVGNQREHAASAQPAQIKAARLASSVSPRVRARHFNL